MRARLFDVVSRANPFGAHGGEAAAHVVVAWTTGVVHAERRLAARQVDLTEWNADAVRALYMDASAVRKRVAVIVGGRVADDGKRSSGRNHHSLLAAGRPTER